jgi:methylphosphotriester-DNA--protein-cysteine methyltransferase
MILAATVMVSGIFLMPSCKMDKLFSNNQTVFVGDTFLKIFHKSTCNLVPAYGQRIYFDTKIDAIRSGYTACQFCHP